MSDKKVFALRYKEALKLQKNLSDGSSIDLLRNGVIIRIGTDDIVTLYSTDGNVMGRLKKEKDENQADIPFADMEVAFAVDIKPLEKLGKKIEDKEEILCTFEEDEEKDEHDNSRAFVTFHLNGAKEIIKLRAKIVQEDILDKIDKYLDEERYTDEFSLSKVRVNTKKLSKVSYNEEVVIRLNKDMGDPIINDEGSVVGEQSPVFLINTRDKEYTGVIMARHDKIGEDNPPEETETTEKDDRQQDLPLEEKE